MGGNHEHWLNGLFSKFPEFIGMLGIPKALRLKEGIGNGYHLWLMMILEFTEGL